MVMPINKEKLELRAKVARGRPDFKRPESWRLKRLETTWRKPKGIDNHQRKQKSRGRPGLVKIGYGTPKIAKWFFTTMEKEKHSHYIFALNA